jgi:hypothetical protein
MYHKVCYLQATDYRSSLTLELMEMKMTIWYNSYDNEGHRRSFEDLQLGGFYAVKYVSESKPMKWLR